MFPCNRLYLLDVWSGFQIVSLLRRGCWGWESCRSGVGIVRFDVAAVSVDDLPVAIALGQPVRQSRGVSLMYSYVAVLACSFKKSMNLKLLFLVLKATQCIVNVGRLKLLT